MTHLHQLMLEELERRNYARGRSTATFGWLSSSPDTSIGRCDLGNPFL